MDTCKILQVFQGSKKYPWYVHWHFFSFTSSQGDHIFFLPKAAAVNNANFEVLPSPVSHCDVSRRGCRIGRPGWSIPALVKTRNVWGTGCLRWCSTRISGVSDCSTLFGLIFELTYNSTALTCRIDTFGVVQTSSVGSRPTLCEGNTNMCQYVYTVIV